MSKQELELLRQKIAELFGKNPDEAVRKTTRILENWIHSTPNQKPASPTSPSPAKNSQKVRKKAA